MGTPGGLADPFASKQLKQQRIFDNLSRSHLTYTPMTRKSLQKQASFKPAFNPIIPVISSSSTTSNSNGSSFQNPNKKSTKSKAQTTNIKSTPIPAKNKKASRNKKRRFSEMSIEKEAPQIIPGSVPRKKRRLSSNGPSTAKCKKKKLKRAKMTNSAKKKVMKRVLNNA